MRSPDCEDVLAAAGRGVRRRAAARPTPGWADPHVAALPDLPAHAPRHGGGGRDLRGLVACARRPRGCGAATLAELGARGARRGRGGRAATGRGDDAAAQRLSAALAGATPASAVACRGLGPDPRAGRCASAMYVRGVRLPDAARSLRVRARTRRSSRASPGLAHRGGRRAGTRMPRRGHRVAFVAVSAVSPRAVRNAAERGVGLHRHGAAPPGRAPEAQAGQPAARAGPRARRAGARAARARRSGAVLVSADAPADESPAATSGAVAPATTVQGPAPATTTTAPGALRRRRFRGAAGDQRPRWLERPGQRPGRRGRPHRGASTTTAPAGTRVAGRRPPAPRGPPRASGH